RAWIARSWQPRRHRNPSFRPVALRPRLSTGLPLSLSPKCQSVAVCSQVRNEVPCHISPTRGSYVSRRRRAGLPEASRTHEMARVEAAPEIAVGDREPGARRVNEAPASRIDADVIDMAGAGA